MGESLDPSTSVVRPFRSRIVRAERAPAQVSPMFDALGSSQAAERVWTSSPTDPDAYRPSAAGLYVYRLRRGHQEHVGVVGDVRAAAFAEGRVRGHEAVQEARVDALVEHFTSGGPRSELVALLHHAGPVEQAAVAHSVASEPLVRFTSLDDWEQTVWRVPEHFDDDLVEELAGAAYYIADGHHRVAASLEVWQRAGRPADAGVLCVLYPYDGLRLLSFHRRVAGPVDRDAVLGLLSEDFAVQPATGFDEPVGCFRMYLDGRWFDVDHTGARPSGARGLDAAVLGDQVLDPLLRATGRRVEVTSALTPLDELAKACDEDGGVLFALRPPPLEQLIEIADGGEVMPPKTTYFDPKPYAGIFLR
ncbi:MAG TPA: DUF1015 family protein [Marmoricola sp.]|nr:DUF1015 family protein [Marmoricola sp.]